MADLFSEAWMKAYQEQWNNEPEVSNALANIAFSSIIAYGFIDDKDPKGILVVEKGSCVASGIYDGETTNWDFRASEENWAKWSKEPLNISSFGMAYTARKLKCKVGDFPAMIKDPRLVMPFIKAFSLMSHVNV
ncbi:MAG: SCP-2 sterol transfer family protein [Microcoleaceae cyanobacterium]